MCFEERKTPVNCITLFSIVVAICGIVIAVFTYLGMDKEVFEELSKTKSTDDINIGDV